MVEKGVAAKVELVRLEQRLNETQGQLEAARLSLPRIESALAEARHRKREKEQNFRGEAMSRLSATEVELAAADRSREGGRRQAQTHAHPRPVSGVIKTVAATTIGEVVRPGVSIVEIVPAEESLLVEARVKPQDIAFLASGQPAVIELTAYDPTRYGGLKGTLEQIGADSVTTEKGETFYTVRLRTNETALHKDGRTLPSSPAWWLWRRSRWARRPCSTTSPSQSCGLRMAHFRSGERTGGAERDRTAGLVIANDALSQLSYSPELVSESRRCVTGRQSCQCGEPVADGQDPSPPQRGSARKAA